ncbi:MAG: PilZ domain-containing protein [Bdellovibrionota bacterium]
MPLPASRVRRARRTIIQESFNLFLVIPESLGMARIYLRDISKLGLSFRSEIEIGLKANQELHARVYLNPAFFLPIDCKVVRIQGNDFGVEFLKPDVAAVQALALLQDFFEAAEKAGVLVE